MDHYNRRNNGRYYGKSRSFRPYEGNQNNQGEQYHDQCHSDNINRDYDKTRRGNPNTGRRVMPYRRNTDQYDEQPVSACRSDNDNNYYQERFSNQQYDHQKKTYTADEFFRPSSAENFERHHNDESFTKYRSYESENYDTNPTHTGSEKLLFDQRSNSRTNFVDSLPPAHGNNFLCQEEIPVNECPPDTFCVSVKNDSTVDHATNSMYHRRNSVSSDFSSATFSNPVAHPVRSVDINYREHEVQPNQGAPPKPIFNRGTRSSSATSSYTVGNPVHSVDKNYREREVHQNEETPRKRIFDRGSRSSSSATFSKTVRNPVHSVDKNYHEREVHHNQKTPRKRIFNRGSRNSSATVCNTVANPAHSMDKNYPERDVQHNQADLRNIIINRSTPSSSATSSNTVASPVHSVDKNYRERGVQRNQADLSFNIINCGTPSSSATSSNTVANPVHSMGKNYRERDVQRNQADLSGIIINRGTPNSSATSSNTVASPVHSVDKNYRERGVQRNQADLSFNIINCGTPSSSATSSNTVANPVHSMDKNYRERYVQRNQADLSGIIINRGTPNSSDTSSTHFAKPVYSMNNDNCESEAQTNLKSPPKIILKSILKTRPPMINATCIANPVEPGGENKCSAICVSESAVTAGKSSDSTVKLDEKIEHAKPIEVKDSSTKINATRIANPVQPVGENECSAIYVSESAVTAGKSSDSTVKLDKKIEHAKPIEGKDSRTKSNVSSKRRKKTKLSKCKTAFKGTRRDKQIPKKNLLYKFHRKIKNNWEICKLELPINTPTPQAEENFSNQNHIEPIEPENSIEPDNSIEPENSNEIETNAQSPTVEIDTIPSDFDFENTEEFDKNANEETNETDNDSNEEIETLITTTTKIVHREIKSWTPTLPADNVTENEDHTIDGEETNCEEVIDQLHRSPSSDAYIEGPEKFVSIPKNKNQGKIIEEESKYENIDLAYEYSQIQINSRSVHANSDIVKLDEATGQKSNAINSIGSTLPSPEMCGANTIHKDDVPIDEALNKLDILSCHAMTSIKVYKCYACKSLSLSKEDAMSHIKTNHHLNCLKQLLKDLTGSEPITKNDFIALSKLAYLCPSSDKELESLRLIYSKT